MDSPGSKRQRSQFVLGTCDNNVPTQTTVEMSWIVGAGHSAFVVDMASFLPTIDAPRTSVSRVEKLGNINRKPSRPIRIARPRLVADLAPHIKAWTNRRSYRSVYEELSKLRWLFYFLDETQDIHTDLPVDMTASQLDSRVALDFSDWLRQQQSIASSRMKGIYSTTAAQLSRCTFKKIWPPCPFLEDPRPGKQGQLEVSYSEAQYVALIRMSKLVIQTFMQDRSKARSDYREIERIDPGRRVAYQAPNKQRGKYQLRNVVLAARESLLRGVRPRYTGGLSWSSSCIVPSRDFVAATFLLVMLRTGANEQPLLDLIPGEGLKPGPWLQKNPFNSEHRTILSWKNRSGVLGSKKKSRVPLTARAKPRFYAIKLIRYQELLGSWCRAVIDVSSTSPESTSNFRTAAQRYRDCFWIYFSEGTWCALTGSSTHRAINSLIEQHASAFPELLDNEGIPIRYSARAIRDAYVAFTAKMSGFSVSTAQMELAHSPDSTAINNYLSKKWARTYAHNAIREFQSATIAVLSTKCASLSPAEIRSRLYPSTAGLPEGGLARVRNGFFCTDPKNPPPSVLGLKATDEVCPALSCHDCVHARCFSSSLPELAAEILNLRARRDQVSLHLWNGSDAEIRLQMLEDIHGRFPEKEQSESFEKAKWIDVPLLEYTPQ